MCICEHVHHLIVQQDALPHYISEITTTFFLVYIFLATYHDRSQINRLTSERSSLAKINNPFVQNLVNRYKNQHSEIIETRQLAGQFLKNSPEISDTSLTKTVAALGDLLTQAHNNSNIEKWHSDGMAKLAEILRADATFSKQSQSTLSFVVQYSNSSQGILFSFNDQTQVLSSSAIYASDEDDNININVGEGIVGQSFTNAEAIFLAEVPANFFRIKSGLGAAAAKSTAILPLVHGNDVVGVLELAGFKAYPLHVQQWLLKSSEAIAATIKTRTAAEKINALLHDSQEKANALISRESELEKIKSDQAKQIEDLNIRHEENLKIVQEKIREVELAKADVEKMRAMERERQNKKNETQSKIIQATLDKFKVQEKSLKEIIEARDHTIQSLQSEIDFLKSKH